MSTSPLGRDTGYPSQYAPQVLHPIDRSAGREPLAIGEPLPFSGRDLWTAWDFTWLDRNGLPRVAVLALDFDAASPCIVESKSLKLYLGSFAMTRIGSARELEGMLAADLGRVSGSDVGVFLHRASEWENAPVGTLPGSCIDDESFSEVPRDVDRSLLVARGETVRDTLHSHLLRSLCPVTAQPDIGSVMVRYRGPRIEPGALLAYLVSYREHQDFHETCVERIFTDILSECRPDRLTVAARYNRRGGIDINPFRSNFETTPETARLWRQ